MFLRSLGDLIYQSPGLRERAMSRDVAAIERLRVLVDQAVSDMLAAIKQRNHICQVNCYEQRRMH